MPLRHLIILLAMLTCSIAGNSSDYTGWLSLPADSLMEMGKRYLAREKADSALACFSIITERTDVGNSDKSHNIVARAYTGKWVVTMFYYNDYARSFDNLLMALKLSHDRRVTMRARMNMGITYHTISQQCSDESYSRKALEAYRQAFADALELGDAEVLDVTISNMLELAFKERDSKLIETQWNQYLKARNATSDMIFRYNRLMRDGMEKALAGKYDEATSLFEKQEKLIGDDPERLRYRTMSYVNRAAVCSLAGRYTDAFSYLDKAEKIASTHNVRDVLMEAYRLKEECMRKAGDSVAAQEYRIRYLELKDNVLTLRQMQAIGEHTFLKRLQQASEDIKEAEIKRSRMSTIAMISLAAALFIAVFLVLLFRKNRQLRERNLTLYGHMESLLKNTPEETDRKYRNSTLDDVQKKELFSKIEEFMNTSDEILSPSFSIARLSEIVGSQYKSVSQVINETCGCNFNTYVNRFRIREACRRMQDSSRYGNLTIEGIAHSVGFKARSSFFIAFKENTGMTPSEYMKIARSKTDKP